MEKKINKVLVCGLGKIGSLLGSMLQESGYEVTGLDATPATNLPYPTRSGDVSNLHALKDIMKDYDAVICCLPYNLTLGVAEVACELGVHYFDLTEDVPTTKAIMQMSKEAKSVLAPQCGLAPGFIGIVGAHLAGKFDKLRSIEMRVGALPQHPRGKLGYAFNWSPEGVVNEYLNDCELIEGGKIKMAPSLEGLETIVLDGLELEAFTTSGGLGTMCETYEGRVDRLNYKTMRYPGHCELMRFFFNELHMGEKRELSGEILTHAKPPVDDDVVFVHAAVEGWQGGKLSREEFVRAYYPTEVAGKTRRAIAWTTCAGVCAVLEMVNNGTLPAKGFIKQEDISLENLFKTTTGRYFAEYEEDNAHPEGEGRPARNAA